MRIAEFINLCGFLPVPVPNNSSVVKQMVDQIIPAGIILTGGNSLVKYGGNAPERDETERALIEMAIKYQIPLYGFCRGMQIILDYFGNDLINVEGHVAVKHEISGLESDMIVNSYHNQACVSLKSDELIAVMKTEDGVIEKVRHKSLPIIATMWHPEREAPFRDIDVDMVKNLFTGRNE